MTGLRASTFPTEGDARVRLDVVLADAADEVRDWLARPRRPRRLALRATFGDDVGVLLVAGMDLPLPVADVVVILDAADGAGEARVLSVYPEATPSWAARQAATGQRGVPPPYPQLEQVALAWLGQDWDFDGATTVQAALARWRAAAGPGQVAEVRTEVAEVRALALPARDLAALFADLGVAAPHPSPADLLGALAEASG